MDNNIKFKPGDLVKITVFGSTEEEIGYFSSYFKYGFCGPYTMIYKKKNILVVVGEITIKDDFRYKCFYINKFVYVPASRLEKL